MLAWAIAPERRSRWGQRVSEGPLDAPERLRWRLLIDGWCIIAACIAAAVGAARGVVRRILVVFDGTVIAGGDALDDVSVAVVAGDVDARVLELLLDVGVRSEDHPAAGDERAGHHVDILHGGGVDAEAHRAESGDGHGVSFGSPCLDDLANGVPGSVDGALADAAAHGGFVDDLGLGEFAVEVGLQYVCVFLYAFLEGDVSFLCLDFDTHSDR